MDMAYKQEYNGPMAHVTVTQPPYVSQSKTLLLRHNLKFRTLRRDMEEAPTCCECPISTSFFLSSGSSDFLVSPGNLLYSEPLHLDVSLVKSRLVGIWGIILT